MQINLAEQVAIQRTKDAIEEIRKAAMATFLLEGNYTDADYGSEPFSELRDARQALQLAQRTMQHVLAVIEGRV